MDASGPGRGNLQQAGREVTYRNLPEAEYAAAPEGFRVPEGFARMIAGRDEGASRGALFDGGRLLSKLRGRPTTPLSAAVAEAIKAGRQHQRV